MFSTTVILRHSRIALNPSSRSVVTDAKTRLEEQTWQDSREQDVKDVDNK